MIQNNLKFTCVLLLILLPLSALCGCEDGDCENGYGTYVFRDGDTDPSSWIVGDSYTGSFLNGKMHGQGIYMSASGNTYCGGFLIGAKSGYGEVSDVKGNSYKGFFKNDLRHGKGIYTDKSGWCFNKFYYLGNIVRK